MKVSNNQHQPRKKISWLLFRLSRKQAYILYVASIIGLTIFSEQLTWYILSYFLNEHYPITELVGYLLAMSIFLYTIIKLKPYLSKSDSPEDENRTVWFGVIINNYKAPLIFMLGLMGIFFSFFMIIRGIDSILSWIITIRTLSTTNHALFIPPLGFAIGMFIGGIINTLLSLYTIWKTRTLSNKKSNNILWFGFKLTHSTQFMIFICSIIWVTIISFLFLTSGSFIIRELLSSSNTLWLVYNFILLAVYIGGILVCIYSLIITQKSSRLV